VVGGALSAVFSAPDYRIERVNHGDEAWAKLASDIRRYDVLLIDHALPRLHALQLVGRLRDADFAERIIVSAHEIKFRR
jgi:DNA-binding response OmpR family regulator